MLAERGLDALGVAFGESCYDYPVVIETIGLGRGSPAVEDHVESPGQVPKLLQRSLEKPVARDPGDGAMEVLIQAQKLDEIPLGAEFPNIPAIDQRSQLGGFLGANAHRGETSGQDLEGHA